MLSGLKASYVRTTPLGWDPSAPSLDNVMSLESAYDPGKDFWLTQSGVTGLLGRGEKDVYRINKASTGASTVSVNLTRFGGQTLNVRLCVVPYTDPSAPPIGTTFGGAPRWNAALPARCANPATRQPIPDGDSYVVVFHDHGQPDDASPSEHRYERQNVGDSVQYVLNLQ